jgi:hypothetical protein
MIIDLAYVTRKRKKKGTREGEREREGGERNRREVTGRKSNNHQMGSNGLFNSPSRQYQRYIRGGTDYCAAER